MIDINEEELLKKKRKGMTYQEIADSVGCSKSAVYRRFKDIDVDPRVLLKPSNLNDLSDDEKAYIAGIVDGEGSIGLWKHRQKLKDHDKVSIRPNVRIGMTDEEVIDYIAETVGTGSRTHKHKELENFDKQHIFALQSQNEVRDFLEQVKPYLRAKSDQAELLIEYCENRNPHEPYTEEELNMVDELKEMKNA